MTYARAVGVDPDAGPPVEELAARSVLAGAGLAVPNGPLALVVTDALTVRAAGEGRVRLDGRLARVPRGREATVVVVTEGPDGPVAAVLEPGTGIVGNGGEPGGGAARHPDPRGRRGGGRADGGPGRGSCSRCCGPRRSAGRRCGRASSRSRTCGPGSSSGSALVSFQAVKQDVARLVEEVALVEAAVAVGVERGGEFGVAVAKAQASESVAEVTRIAHQLHGAVGFTERSPLRLSTTRLWSWRDEDGDERVWAGRLGATAAGTDDLWALVTG